MWCSKMPDGYRIAPHWHPLQRKCHSHFRDILYLVRETSSTKTRWRPFLSAASAYLDPDMHHYAMASGEDFLRGIHEIAPLQKPQ